MRKIYINFRKIILIKNTQTNSVSNEAHCFIYLIAIEEDRLARIPIVRGPGTYGRVSVSFDATGRSASVDVDFTLPAPPQLWIEDGQSEATLNVTIIDDPDMEFAEDFIVELVSAGGMYRR